MTSASGALSPLRKPVTLMDRADPTAEPKADEPKQGAAKKSEEKKAAKAA